MSQTDQGDHSEEVEELTEDKAGKINVVSRDYEYYLSTKLCIQYTYCEYFVRRI